MIHPPRLRRGWLIGATFLLLALGFGAALHEKAPVEMPPMLVLAPDVHPGLSASLHPLPRAGVEAAPRPLPARIGGVASPGTPDTGGLWHEWPGFHAEARFVGSGLILRLDDAAGRYRVRVDENELTLTRPGAVELRIDGLSGGEHRVRFEKLSESWAPAWFGGFFLPTGSQPLPPPQTGRVIEVIGDSDSLGYGIASGGRSCSSDEQFLTTDASQTFPALVATKLGADYRIIARSGITIMRARYNMVEINALALPDDPGAPLAPEPAADVIVIGLGANDLIEQLTDWPGGVNGLREALAGGVEALARARMARAPGARLVLLAFGEYGPDLIEPFRQAQAALPGAELLVLPKLARTACDWHPSLKDHAMIAEQLTRLLSGT